VANQIDKSTLKYLGEDYQFKLVKEFMERKGFIENIAPIVDQNLFTSPFLRTFVGSMLDYYKKENLTPTYSTMKILLHNIARTDTDIELYDGVVKKIIETDSDGSDVVANLAMKFFKQQKIIKFANELLAHASNGDVDYYEKIESKMKAVLNLGIETDYEESQLLDGLDDVLSEEYRTVIPTGISLIDEVLNGGLGKGELGVIISPSGYGKTSMTTSMAQYAATFKSKLNEYQGFKVLQIGFEDKIKQIKRKHFSKITQIEACNLSKEEYKDEVRKRIKDYKEIETANKNLRLIRLPSGRKSVDDIEKIIKTKINEGFRPDLVIIDYFECLKMTGSSSMSKWEKEADTMRKIEALTNQYEIAFWVPVQGNRDSINAELVTMDNAGGALAKIQIAHIIMSITRSLDDIAENRATLTILKNRAGQSGKAIEDIGFFNGTCTVTCDAQTDVLGSMGFSNFKKKAEKKHEDAVDNLAQELMQEIYSDTSRKK
jgi:hypothetical protein